MKQISKKGMEKSHIKNKRNTHVLLQILRMDVGKFQQH